MAHERCAGHCPPGIATGRNRWNNRHLTQDRFAFYRQIRVWSHRCMVGSGGMRLSGMARARTARAWVALASVAALGALPVGAALAQDQQYETPRYTPLAPAGLEKNYGLPTFGMPGNEVPQRKMTAPATATPETMAPETTTSSVPDFFQHSPDTTLPKIQDAKPEGVKLGDSDTDTPLYTTSQGSTTDDTTLSRTGDTTALGTGDTTAMESGDTTASDPADR